MKLIGVEPGGQAWKEDLDQTGDVVGEPRTPPVVRNLRIDCQKLWCEHVAARYSRTNNKISGLATAMDDIMRQQFGGESKLSASDDTPAVIAPALAPVPPPSAEPEKLPTQDPPVDVVLPTAPIVPPPRARPETEQLEPHLDSDAGFGTYGNELASPGTAEIEKELEEPQDDDEGDDDDDNYEDQDEEDDPKLPTPSPVQEPPPADVVLPTAPTEAAAEGLLGEEQEVLGEVAAAPEADSTIAVASEPTPPPTTTKGVDVVMPLPTSRATAEPAPAAFEEAEHASSPEAKEAAPPPRVLPTSIIRPVLAEPAPSPPKHPLAHPEEPPVSTSPIHTHYHTAYSDDITTVRRRLMYGEGLGRGRGGREGQGYRTRYINGVLTNPLSWAATLLHPSTHPDSLISLLRPRFFLKFLINPFSLPSPFSFPFCK